MKPGERVIWLHSTKRSLLTGSQMERTPGEIVRIQRQKIRIRVWMRGRERFVNVYPDNVLCMDEDWLLIAQICRVKSAQSVVPNGEDA